MFAFKTLERRLIALLVVPVILFLLIIGVFGYRFIQDPLFKEWQEIAIMHLEPGLPALHMSVGLHAGEVVVGNIGSESRAKYGIIGAAVNLTHRIQSQAQGGEVMVSDMVFHHCEETVAVSRTFETPLKGIAQPVTLYVVESIRAAP